MWTLKINPMGVLELTNQINSPIDLKGIAPVIIND